jgi:hypothetical protein
MQRGWNDVTELGCGDQRLMALVQVRVQFSNSYTQE